VKVAAVYLVAGALFAAGHGIAHWLDGMNTWLELAIKTGAALATMGGAVKWCIGPGYRFVKRWTLWVREHLELVAKMDNRLDAIEGRLEDGETHFRKIDRVLETFASDEARAVRSAVRAGEPVRLREDGDGLVDRRDLAP
jgi:hypothetical protein